MDGWPLNLFLWLIPLSVALIAWLILAGVQHGTRLRIALAAFVLALLSLLFWPVIE